MEIEHASSVWNSLTNSGANKLARVQRKNYDLENTHGRRSYVKTNTFENH